MGGNAFVLSYVGIISPCSRNVKVPFRIFLFLS